MKKYLYIAKTSMENSIAYSGSFLIRSAFYVLFIYIFLLLWKAIFGNQQSLYGYTLNQMIWYVIITEMIAFSKSNVFSELSDDIKNGNIAYYLNKPYNYVFYQLSNSFGEISFKFIINLTMGIVMGFLFVGQLTGFDISHFPAVMLTILLAILITFFMLLSIGLLAFWAEENSPFYWIYSKMTMMFGMLLPLEFFPNWLQKIINYLPFPYVTYGPAKITVNYSPEKFIEVASVQVIYLIVFIILSLLILKMGVKRLNVNGG